MSQLLSYVFLASLPSPVLFNFCAELSKVWSRRPSCSSSSTKPLTVSHSVFKKISKFRPIRWPCCVRVGACAYICPRLIFESVDRFLRTLVWMLLCYNPSQWQTFKFHTISCSKMVDAWKCEVEAAPLWCYTTCAIPILCFFCRI